MSVNLPLHAVSMAEESSILFREALAKPYINLAFYERTHDLIEAVLLRNSDLIHDDFQFWSVRQNLPVIENALAETIGNIGPLPVDVIELLHHDVRDLIRLFVDVTGETQPFVSLRTVARNYFVENPTSVSNRYHRDSSVITLFKTFMGNGTEWTPDENVIREPWKSVSIQGENEPDEKYVIDPRLVYPTTCKTIGFLKGETCPSTIDSRSLEFIKNFISMDEIVEFNVGGSLIHRGPGVKGDEKRVILTLSSFRLPK